MELLYILTAPIFMLQAVCKYWMSRSYDVYILMQHRHDLQVFYHGLLIILCIFTSPMVDACDLKWWGRNPPHMARQPRLAQVLAVHRDEARGSGGDAPRTRWPGQKRRVSTRQFDHPGVSILIGRCNSLRSRVRTKIPKVQLYIQQLCMHEIIRYLLLRYPGSTKFYSTYSCRYLKYLGDTVTTNVPPTNFTSTVPPGNSEKGVLDLRATSAAWLVPGTIF